MPKDESNCPYCGTSNSYSVATCTQCGEELPWANWVRARETPSDAFGAQAGSLAHGPKPSDGLDFWSGIPTGVLLKMLLVFALIIGGYFVAGYARSSLRSATSASNSAVNPSGNIAADFKKANPTLQQDADDRKTE